MLKVQTLASNVSVAGGGLLSYAGRTLSPNSLLLRSLAWKHAESIQWCSRRIRFLRHMPGGKPPHIEQSERGMLLMLAEVSVQRYKTLSWWYADVRCTRKQDDLMKVQQECHEAARAFTSLAATRTFKFVR